MPPCNSTKFIQIIISGQVQGVGFRPFVYQLAKELGACGFVRNRGGQVEVLLQAELKTLFLAKLDTHKPPQAQINTIECHNTPPIHAQDFKIAPSLTPSLSLKDTLPLDLATCELCLQDLANPKSRFFNYPFVACAHCGPRFSLLHTLPYDRAHTSMRDWVMCPACQKDYHNPQSRRFFAQSLSCPHCPITLSFYDQEGKHTDQPLERAIQAIQQNQVIALKGIGGFALICHAQDKQAVQKVRALKCRPKKPLALMVKNTAVAHTLVHLNPLELEALKAPSAPIVLAYKKSPCYDHVAPNLNTLGIILPYECPAPLAFATL
ncbi:[NiFe] hydrogenase metallocenter assembly protein HypF [Helicobacter bizzozeronii CIII-1]|uniref:acylphosphatase n=1 Tax=Helicobacter bizzozeronii (strain CIII-1) TaxID=1002804 RepID=F8KTG2_HELBC|nr:Sua5/YciO/YrdC/YwlC family protein [Helicobacter bizzozeronii]CCB80117.1 [NiFe] hydrogenase metallocenter assembly protein HypF [Helicobacter bizzozeronii CIII-1]